MHCAGLSNLQRQPITGEGQQNVKPGASAGGPKLLEFHVGSSLNPQYQSKNFHNNLLYNPLYIHLEELSL